MAKKYDVGYSKPPQHTQFKKGQSGNPAGRPKGARSLQEELKRLLAAKTKIKSNGVIKTVPAVRALGIMLMQKAMAGDVRALSKIVEIAGPGMTDELKAAAGELSPTDLDMLRRALEVENEQTLNPEDSSICTRKDDDA